MQSQLFSFFLLCSLTFVFGARPLSTCNKLKHTFFCEDFEVRRRNPVWRLEGAARVSSSGPVRGRRSLHLTPVGGQFGRLVLDDVKPRRRSFFGRIYLRVRKFPTAPNYAHWLFVEAIGTKPDDERIRPVNGQLIDEVGGKNMWGVGSDGGRTGDWTAWRESAVAQEKIWTCVEWQMLASDSSVRVWIDGLEKPELQVSRFNHGGKNGTQLKFPRRFKQIWFGFWNFQPDTTPNRFDVYVDDIALSKRRIRC